MEPKVAELRTMVARPAATTSTSRSTAASARPRCRARPRPAPTCSWPARRSTATRPGWATPSQELRALAEATPGLAGAAHRSRSPSRSVLPSPPAPAAAAPGAAWPTCAASSAPGSFGDLFQRGSTPPTPTGPLAQMKAAAVDLGQLHDAAPRRGARRGRRTRSPTSTPSLKVLQRHRPRQPGRGRERRQRAHGQRAAAQAASTKLAPSRPPTAPAAPHHRHHRH